MKLLIVDDGLYVVEYLKHLLDWKLFGIEHVQTSTNSIEAKELLQHHIDILITDIRMPEVSGIDLLEHINEQQLKTKVIFLSGYSQFDYAQKAIRLGLLDYLLKPVDKEDMEKAIEQAVKAIKAQPLPSAIDWEDFDHKQQHDKTKNLTNDHTIRLIRDYIESHLGDCLSLEELGEQVHLHPVYLSKLYKQETGENLSSYIAMRRLEKATRLLLGSKLHVVDISHMVGYKKTQYFIKLFKDEYGVTPQQYRKMHL